MKRRPPLFALVEQRGEDDLIYDAGTNRFLWVDHLTTSLLPYWGAHADAEIADRFGAEHGRPAILRRLAFLRKLERERGWLQRRRPRAFAPPWSREEMRRSLATGLDCLVLSVTEACNYRCAYCVYGGGYRGQRRHSLRAMSLETADAALAYFAAHSSAARELHLNFYGGEPLLNLPVVRRALDAFPGLARGRPCFYHLSTNGWLLQDPAIRRLFAERRVILMVSLDGPQPLHDRRRRTTGGRGTFLRVMQALAALHKEFPDYFRSHVMVNAVLDAVTDLPAVRRFFRGHPLLAPLEIVCSTVRRDRIDPPTEAEDRTMAKLERELFARVATGRTTFDSIMRRVFVRELARVHQREEYVGSAAREVLTGVCIPGRKELFVDPAGRFHLCENTSDDLTVGSLETGHDLEAVHRIVRQFCELASERCVDCFAYRFCRLCYVHAFSGRELDRAKMDSYCGRERAQFLATLRRYAWLRKLPDANIAFLEERTPADGGTRPSTISS